MASSEEPVRKKPATESSIDFRLCVLCQGDKFTNIKGDHQLEQLRQPELGSYQPLVDCIQNTYQNPEYVRLHQKLSGASGEELNNQHAVWHKSCHGKATHKQHIDRDKVRYDKAVLSHESSVLLCCQVGGRPSMSQTSSIPDQATTASTSSLTRSRYPRFQREHCFYCQNEKICGGKTERLVTCRSSNVGVSIQDIVDVSGNERWKVNLAHIIADADFLSRDIKYHKHCHTANWRKYVQAKQRATNREPSVQADSTLQFISAEIEFSAELQDSLDQGSILTLSEVTTQYNNKMLDHGIQNQQITRALLLAKIEEQISNFTITVAKGRKPAVIYSRETVRSAIDTVVEEHDVRRDMKVIFRCSKLIRQSILQSRKSNPWTFNGSLTNCEEQCVPAELVTMMMWIVQGAQTAMTDTRAKELNNTCRILSNSIVQACKTNRQMSLTTKSTTAEFRCTFESPFSVGLSLYMYHSFRSQKAITMLNNAGVGITYDRVQKICNNIANSVCENMREYGVYVPPGLLKNKTIRASMDNIDKKVDTPDGKHSFHGMAIGVYQSPGDGDAIVKQLQFGSEQSVSETLRNVPQTVIQILPCSIKGSPKPQTSPQYANYKMGIYAKLYDASQVNDFAWMAARYCNRANSVTNTDLSGAYSGAQDVSESRTSQLDESVGPAKHPEGLVDNQRIEKQHVHLWSAYNS